ncbi:hypothetical protein PAESOLCIP111_04978 [Paenibacillus solanacearum]|uniref:Uncharacterized protein n=1 Tax=Paenibacillus solanacearum TaxID=2048548 RepID=A0A916NYI3_9BACL|nr:hypothetical protein [Paenibacillus solanacearum]CAG7645557.1 hypothetical protein PAESOLCIP111_04978 [Paenibacillus solanacearum]
MNAASNERGAAALLYVLIISAVMAVVASTVIFLTSTDSATNVSDQNSVIATNLAVSGMESFIAYLDSYSSGSRDDFLNGYPGFIQKDYKLPEGTPVSYKLTKAGPANNVYTVTCSVTAGAGYAKRTKTVTYTINASSPPRTGTVISTDPSLRDPSPVSPQRVFVQGNTTRLPSSVTVVKNNSLQKAIGDALAYYEKSANDYIASLEANATLCTCGSEADIKSAVNASTKNPVVIKMAYDINFNNDTTLNFSTPSRPVILIFNNVTFNQFGSINMTGDLIVKNTIMFNKSVSELKLDKSGSGAYGNLYVKGSFTGNQSVSMTVPGMLYAGQMTFNSNTPAKVGKLVVRNRLLLNQVTSLELGSDLLAGELTVNQDSIVSAPLGDVLVQNQFLSNQSVNLRAGGSVAVGGDFTNNGGNTKINTGGATTSLLLGSDVPGGSEGGGSGSSLWSPARQ